MIVCCDAQGARQCHTPQRCPHAESPSARATRLPHTCSHRAVSYGQDLRDARIRAQRRNPDPSRRSPSAAAAEGPAIQDLCSRQAQAARGSRIGLLAAPAKVAACRLCRCRAAELSVKPPTAACRATGSKMQPPPPGQFQAVLTNGGTPAAAPGGALPQALALPPAAERAPPEPAGHYALQAGGAGPAAPAEAVPALGVSEATSAAAGAAAEAAGQRRVTRASSRAAAPPVVTASKASGSDGLADAEDRPPAMQEVKQKLAALGATFLFDKVRPQTAWAA